MFPFLNIWLSFSRSKTFVRNVITSFSWQLENLARQKCCDGSWTTY